MSFKNNYNKLLLLTNSNEVLFEVNEKSFILKIPTLYDVYFDNDIMFFLNYIDKEVSEIQKFTDYYEIKNHLDFIIFTLSIKDDTKEIQELKKTFWKTLKQLIPGIQFDKIMTVNQIFIGPDIFNEIIRILLESIGKDKIFIKDNDDEFTRIEKQAKIRADNIRKKGKKEQENGMKIENILAAILYEFPQYKLEDLFKMNLHSIYYLFGYVWKIANYEVNKIALGNGLLKNNKFKYFIE